MSSLRKQKRRNQTFWDHNRGKIHTRKGGWVIGEAVYSHGYSMMDDLVGRVSFFQVLLLNATGRLPERRLADWLEAFFICLSWPDARVWCNQIGSLGGTMRISPVAAVTAGTLASDSGMYGPATLVGAADFIASALCQSKNGTTADQIVQGQMRRPGSKPVIVGYVRPVATGDERVVAMERVTEQLHFQPGAHLRLAYEIEKVMADRFGEGMNVGGYAAAFLLDQGYTGDEMYRMCSVLVCSGVHACYAEALEQPAESFFPLRCRDIDYQGKPFRTVPS